MSRLYRPRYWSGEIVRPRLAIGMEGQSGCAGRKNTLFLTPPSLKTLLETPNPRVQLYDWEGTNAPQSVPMYDTLGPLQPRPFPNPTPNAGAELSIGQYVDSLFPDVWAIFKASVGGTSLAVDWDPNSTSIMVGGLNLTNFAIQRFRQGEQLTKSRLTGVFSVRGESDALDINMANAYEANLRKQIAYWRRYWPNLWWGISRISEQLDPALYLYKEIVRAAQVKVAGDTPGCFYIDTDDLGLDTFKEYLINSIVTIGYRAAPWINRRVGLLVAPTVDFTVQKSGLAVQFTDLSTVVNAGQTVQSWRWDFGDGTKSSLQNPQHTYAADGAYNVTLTVTDTLNQAASVTYLTTVAVPTWTVDATSGKGMPATTAEWQQLINKHLLGIPVPSHLWIFNPASGNITDVIGGKTLTAAGGPLYQQLVAGWSSFFVGPNGTGVNQTFSNTTMQNVNAHNSWLMGYGIYNVTAQNAQRMFHGGADNNSFEAQATTAKARIRTGSNAANSTQDHDGVVRPFSVGSDLAGQRSVLWTDIEKVNNTFGTPASGITVTVQVGIFADAASSFRCAYLAQWEDFCPSDAQVKATKQALAWAVSGY